MEIAKWLHELCYFTRNELMIYNNQAFRCACNYGHIEIAKWLHSLCQFTNDVLDKYAGLFIE